MFVRLFVGKGGGLVRCMVGRFWAHVTAVSGFFLIGQIRGVEMNPRDVLELRPAGRTGGREGGGVVGRAVERRGSRSNDHKSTALSFSVPVSRQGQLQWRGQNKLLLIRLG